MQLQPITQLLHQRMNRQEFLRTVGLIVLTIVGLGMLMKQQPANKQVGATQTQQPTNDNYGA